MSDPAFDPLSVDVAAFAKQGGTASGVWPLAALDRLCEEAHPDAKPAWTEAVDWRVAGEARARHGGEPEIWLHLACKARLALVCQRCLQAVEVDAHVDRSFQFVAGEALAAEIDADSEDDVLALSRTLNLVELIEDELLLGLPLVPRHSACPQPLRPPADPEPFEERANPFAVLGDLKRKSLPN
jgi:uncharacterized protein